MSPSDDQTTVREIDIAQANDLLRKGEAVLVDVREVEEFAAERIPGALLSPLSTFDPASLAGLKGKRVVVSCLAGGRSMRAAQALAPVLGASSVVSMAGGLGAWKQAGLPTIRG
ncbi:MAG: rhodanese-like domain-containing protein [Rhodospirillales bacterium]|nr:rhodanese-like domain-containing protein [Rhodospirillales bacterium]